MVSSGDIFDKGKEVLHQGNIRTFTVKKQGGDVVIALPLTIAVIVAVVAPFVVAVGAIAALVAGWSISVEREEPATG